MNRFNRSSANAHDLFVNNFVVEALSASLVVLSGLLAFVAVTTV